MNLPDSETNRIAREYVRTLERSISAEGTGCSQGIEPRAVTVARARISGAPVATPLPGLAGYRLMSPGFADIYLMDPGGYRRRVAHPTTYTNLFRDWSGIVDANLDHIAQRPPLEPGTILIRDDQSDKIYLLDRGRKRLITTALVMDKYWFKCDRVCVMPQALVESLPIGEDWE